MVTSHGYITWLHHMVTSHGYITWLHHMATSHGYTTPILIHYVIEIYMWNNFIALHIIMRKSGIMTFYKMYSFINA